MFIHKNWCYVLFGQWSSCPDVKKSPCVLAKKWTSDVYGVVLSATLNTYVDVHQWNSYQSGQDCLSAVSYFCICFCKPVQYALSNHEESHPVTQWYAWICSSLGEESTSAFPYSPHTESEKTLNSPSYQENQRAA